MTHIRLQWTPLIDDGRQVVEVQVLVGPAERAIRLAGELRLHPVELNALDRLLACGARFEAPANTYRLEASPAEIERRDRQQKPMSLRERRQAKVLAAELMRRATADER